MKMQFQMKKIIFRMPILAAVCVCAISCVSCEKDNELSVPKIESVWSNMSTQPFEQMECAYPKQTICLRGSGFSAIDKLNVNGTIIDLSETKFYNTDNSIIIALPDDVATTTSTELSFLEMANGAGKAVYEPFYIFDADKQPEITNVSSTTLVPGKGLTIKGSNLDGAVEVYLPLVFDQKVKCEFDSSKNNSDTEIHVTVPEGVSFAQGRIEVVLHKMYAPTNDEYTDKVYSDVINFK